MIKLFLFALLSATLLSATTCNNKHSTEQASEQTTDVQAEKPAEQQPSHQPDEPTSGHKPANISTLQVVYGKYKNGEIEACQYNGATVYKAGLNAPDAGSVIYNGEGIKIGSCNYGWGKPDSMCEKLQSCEDVYRVAENIWGKPAVDKFGLAK